MAVGPKLLCKFHNYLSRLFQNYLSHLATVTGVRTAGAMPGGVVNIEGRLSALM
jgi:hypothetical protein